MSKKVFVLAGSPRKGGNSDLLCDAFLNGARQAGHETEKGNDNALSSALLTCTGSDAAEMTHHVRNITTLPSVSRTISHEKTEVFPNCVSDKTCAESAQYLARAKTIGAWAAK